MCVYVYIRVCLYVCMLGKERVRLDEMLCDLKNVDRTFIGRKTKK